MKTRCNYPRCPFSFKRSTFRVPDAQRALVAQLLKIRLLDSLYICELHFWTEAFARRGLKPALRKDAPFISLLIMPDPSLLSPESPKLHEASLLDTLPRPIISIRKAFANWNSVTSRDGLALCSSSGSSASSDVGTTHSFRESSTSSLRPDFTSPPRAESYLFESKFQHLETVYNSIKLESDFQYEYAIHQDKPDQGLNVESNCRDVSDVSNNPHSGEAQKRRDPSATGMERTDMKRPRHDVLSEPEEDENWAYDSDGSWLEGLLMPPCSPGNTANYESSSIEESTSELRFDDFF